MAAPLTGIRVVELAGIGPGPFCGMMLADHGAEVIRIDRPGATLNPRDPLLRGRAAMQLDLKSPGDIAKLRDLVKTADGLIEGFRPGVMERLGIGPDVLLGDNPKLVIGRMTGWGQDGPYAPAAGHDINYIALSGVLGAIGRAGEKPVPPINLIGDFGGGAMMLAFGMVSGLLAVRNGAPGQVIDCAMTDGSALLMGMMWGFRASGMWTDERGVNMLDGGAPFYDVYETADGGFVSIGSIEPQFYALLREKLGIDGDPLFDAQFDRAQWPAQKERLTAIFKSRTRDEWCAAMEGSDVCFAPVLSMAEAAAHPHNVARGTFIEQHGVMQPAPAPRFS
ncbi:CaiB/BaiF CoA-transferase family protein [Sphingomonas bacterium]|uniref:CaiB/BaiF CoA transferase family protein n=1 Tax=Sphingomonas bacterium TaxID=1895847 RepID=UPI002629B3B4|nr:CaiB/BaiF CoA-transferase family protein [Sphingomonas bacterium]MDB5679476.1 carnitine dehydratase [Sphingomonas bacterium]